MSATNIDIVDYKNKIKKLEAEVVCLVQELTWAADALQAVDGYYNGATVLRNEQALIEFTNRRSNAIRDIALEHGNRKDRRGK